jgi:hypothetical protein
MSPAATLVTIIIARHGREMYVMRRPPHDLVLELVIEALEEHGSQGLEREGETFKREIGKRVP